MSGIKKALKFNSILLGLITIIIFFTCLLYQYILMKYYSNKFNLIIISVDTLRPDHMGVYGYKNATTPNIDEWAQKAAIFSNVYTIVPETDPSFRALMTGRYPLTSRTVNQIDMVNKIVDPISSNTKTLAKILKAQNFYTGAFLVSSQLDPLNTRNEVGFDDFNFAFYWDLDSAGKINKVHEASDWLDKNKDKRFFLWLHLIDPHAPYTPPDDLRCKFNSGVCSNISNFTEAELEITRSKLKACNTAVDQQTIDLYKSLYDGEIAFSDELLKPIFNQIKSSKLDKNTIVVFYSDHGEGFDHNYNFHHGNLYDSNSKIALMIYSPNNQKQIRVNNLIQNTDILPTILDLLNISYKIDNTNSISFSNLINRNLWNNLLPFTKRQTAYSFTSYLNKFSIIEDNYKYILSIDDLCLFNNQKEELYDLNIDKQETNNLVIRDKKIAEKMKKKLLDHFAPYNLPPTIMTQDDIRSTKKIIEILKSAGY